MKPSEQYLSNEHNYRIDFITPEAKREFLIKLDSGVIDLG